MKKIEIFLFKIIGRFVVLYVFFVCVFKDCKIIFLIKRRKIKILNILLTLD